METQVNDGVNPLPTLYDELKISMVQLAGTFSTISAEQLAASLLDIAKIQAEIQEKWTLDEPLRGLSAAQKQLCKNLLTETESLNSTISQLATSQMAALRSEEQVLRMGRTTLSSYKSAQDTIGRIVSVSS